MRQGTTVVLALALVLVGLAAPASAQSNMSGAISGTVKDTDGGVLPGVTVSLRSSALVAGEQRAISDERGNYRFPSLPPGVYTLEAGLSGFRTVRQENVRVSLGQGLSIALTMELASATEELIVTGDAPIVSVVDNAVSSNLTQEYLERQPLPRDVNSLVNYAPAVNNGRAYGGTEERTLAFNLDGVNVSNPASGEHWALTNMDWLKEVQVVGLGAPAEYGGFTGAVFNLVTKSGGNTVEGDATLYYSGGSLVSTNADKSAQGTSLLPSEKDSDWDVSVSLGGPAIKDRLWYFVSAQISEADVVPYYRANAPENERRNQVDTKHRYMGKATFEPSSSNRLVGMVFYDDRYFDRRGAGAAILASASQNQESPNWEYNGTWESLVNQSNFLSVKLTGFTGRDDRLPLGGTDKPGRTDDTTGFGWDNRAFTLEQKVERATLDASWNLFADGLLGSADSHAFKLGASYEWGHYDQEQYRSGGFTYYDRSSRCTDTNGDGSKLDDYFASPSCAAYSSDWGNEIYLDAVTTGLNAFAQDSVRVDRWTFNYGVRYTRYEGGFKHGDKDVYSDSFFAPRLGFVWDVFGDSRTALKAHAGRYYMGLFAYLYDREVSGEAYTPYEIRDYNSQTGQYDILVRRTLTVATLDDDIAHPYADQLLLSVEQRLGRDMSLGLDLTYRKDHDIIAMVNANDDYVEAFAPNNPLTGGNQLLYDLRSDPVFVLTNPKDAYREYRSAILRFEKRYSHGWLLRASLVWADLEGNALKNNSYVPEWQDKTGQINADGRLPNFSRWEFKLSSSVDLPWGIVSSLYYTYLSGEYWTPYVQVSGLSKNNRSNVNITERGSQQLDDRHLVDLRLGKTFRLGGDLRLNLFADAFNLLNSDTVTAVDQRWGSLTYKPASPATSTWASRTAYQAPTAMESPREVRLGLRLSF